MTNDSKVSMPVLADLLADRLRINNWVVAFKALITSHNLMTLGNEVLRRIGNVYSDPLNENPTTLHNSISEIFAIEMHRVKFMYTVLQK